MSGQRGRGTSARGRHRERAVSEFWEHFDSDDAPFGQEMQTFLEVASSLFDRRMEVLERDRGKGLAEIERATLADIAADW